MGGYSYCTITPFLCCCGMPSCRLAVRMRFLSTVGGSSRSIAGSAARSTSISHHILCFLMRARGPHGSSGMTWIMPWRRLLTWRSPPCAHRTCLSLRACLSRCIQSRTSLTRSGRHTCMRQATSFMITTIVVGRTWRAMPSTCSSCSTTPSALLPDSGAVLVVMPRRSSPFPRRSVVWPRSMVPCSSR
jgi:hypothetical protein